MTQLVPARASSRNLPALVATSGEPAARRFIDFFTSNIRNRNTREAYRRAVADFLAWCEAQRVASLAAVEPLHIATWIEALGREASAPTDAPPEDTLKGVRDRAILATLLYHGMRREELCRLRVRDIQSRQGALHFRVKGKRDKVRFVPVHVTAQRLIEQYPALAGHAADTSGPVFRPVTKTAPASWIGRSIPPRFIATSS